MHTCKCLIVLQVDGHGKTFVEVVALSTYLKDMYIISQGVRQYQSGIQVEKKLLRGEVEANDTPRRELPSQAGS
jgi:hypothetical protein